MKTRMNNAHRDVLREFAHKKIVEVVDRKLEDKLYAKLITKTNSVIRKKYPEKDIEVLRKYELTRVDTCLVFQFPSGRVGGITFEEEEAEDKIAEMPYTRGCNSRAGEAFAVDSEIEELIEQYTKERDKNREIISNKRKDCNTLINFAKYVEDVLEVIKVPKEIETRLTAKSTALVALTPEVIGRIQADFNY